MKNAGRGKTFRDKEGPYLEAYGMVKNAESLC
jgi:hypothetical protein